MKQTIIAILLSCIGQLTYAQDIFKEYLFSVDHILEHRVALVLSEEQEKQIRQLHNNSIPEFNNMKWDLDAEVVRLTEMISKSSVEVSASVEQLEKILRMENQVKVLKMQTLLEIKNVLSPDQQDLLMELDDGETDTYTFISSVNEDPRVTIRVSGYADKSKNEEPLFVIDYGNRVEEVAKVPKNISPDDIKSIEVLKGESARKIYGDKGKNGVVVIKLKE
jgi:hypothetical protein